MAEALQTPIVFLIFNRPTATARVFEEIRRVRPAKLLIVADGPRQDRAGEEELCGRTREIVRQIDWHCTVLRRFSAVNLGCRQNVASGLDWAFTHVEEAIILEDDCLPDLSFFPFCEELLGRYRNNTRISEISGSNYQLGFRRTKHSYYFSRHAHIWGWATWRRSWQEKDIAMTAWQKLRAGKWLHDLLGDGKAAFYWRKIFDDCYRNSPDSLNSWAVPWTFSCWVRGALSIIPEVNLIENIGHFGNGTNMTITSAVNKSEVTPMQFPLRHPLRIEAHRNADLFTEETFYYGQNIPERLFWNLRIPLSLAAARKMRRWAKIR